MATCSPLCRRISIALGSMAQLFNGSYIYARCMSRLPTIVMIQIYMDLYIYIAVTWKIRVFTSAAKWQATRSGCPYGLLERGVVPDVPRARRFSLLRLFRLVGSFDRVAMCTCMLSGQSISFSAICGRMFASITLKSRGCAKQN